MDLLEKAGGGRVHTEPRPSDSVDPSALATRLEPEYVRLFVNNRDAEPAHLEALAWLHDRRQRARTQWIDRIREIACRLGVDVDVGSPYPIDHLTILFELLYLEQPDGVPALCKNPIWSELIAPWMPAFLETLRGLRPHPYYDAAAEVLTVLSTI